MIPTLTKVTTSSSITDVLRPLTDSAAAVSFDFFDTLFTRPLADPEDAFDIIARQFGITDFRQHRRAAQTEAFRRMAAAGRKEIRFSDIYTCLSETGLPSEALMRAEYALEQALLEPNPEMLVLAQQLHAAGKPVVITSDMYLGSEFFREVLQPHGLAKVPIFVSADCNATKRDRGELFDMMAQQLGLPKGNILHIGDNPLADVEQPRARGLQAFHYQPRQSTEPTPLPPKSLDTSISHGLWRIHAHDIEPNSLAALGYLHGGPANLGFLQWISEQARQDGIEHLLFLSRDGYILDRIARHDAAAALPPFRYFLGSRTTYTLAAMTADNFSSFLPFLLSGAHGLAPAELLERIGVTPPAPAVMADLGLGDEIQVTPALHDRLARFLYAWRWEILKICQRTRGALYRYLRQTGLSAGARVAVVDVGWSGTTQEAFELALQPLLPLEVHGYYFCLADTPERLRRANKQRMAALIDSSNMPSTTVANIYAHRMVVELMFSAPHPSVIGLRDGYDVAEPIYDIGRGDCGNHNIVAAEICRGAEAYAWHRTELQRRLKLPTTPLQMAWPLIEWITKGHSANHPLLTQIINFDAWSSTRHARQAIRRV
jgi:FMN phosphatase YigB (HAD superfamily)